MLLHFVYPIVMHVSSILLLVKDKRLSKYINRDYYVIKMSIWSCRVQVHCSPVAASVKQ